MRLELGRLLNGTLAITNNDPLLPVGSSCAAEIVSDDVCTCGSHLCKRSWPGLHDIPPHDKLLERGI